MAEDDDLLGLHQMKRPRYTAPASSGSGATSRRRIPPRLRPEHGHFHNQDDNNGPLVEHNWRGVLKVFLFTCCPFVARQLGIYASLLILQRCFGSADI
jgi:hypothetical protein